MAHFLPERRVDNAELARELGVPIDACGVSFRHYAAEGQGPSDLARAAASTALDEAGMSAADLDFLIFATMTPDVTFPGAGCYLQEKLGCRTIGALDLRAQCAGFIFALDVAWQFLRAGSYRRILIAAGDVHSSGLDFSSAGASVTPLFGDGAVAVILGDEGENLIESVIHTDASDFERFWCELPSSRRRPIRFVADDLSVGKHYPKIDPGAVRRDGIVQIRAAVAEVLEKARLRAADVSRFVFQHVYRDVAIAAADELGVSGRASIGGANEGHIASASLPMALCRARANGEIRSGDLVCLATAGAGANWGAALLRL